MLGAEMLRSLTFPVSHTNSIKSRPAPSPPHSWEFTVLIEWLIHGSTVWTITCAEQLTSILLSVHNTMLIFFFRLTTNSPLLLPDFYGLLVTLKISSLNFCICICITGQIRHIQSGSEVAVQQSANSRERVAYSASRGTSPCAWASPSDCPADETSLSPSPGSPAPCGASARRGSRPRPNETVWSSARSASCCAHLDGLGSWCRLTVARSAPVTAACWPAQLQIAAIMITSNHCQFFMRR